ncbi:class III extradiol dioxygenase subunit B-like domain-containing protein [Streptomyces sp. NPDC002018]|uniref:class III extradiol dioxygenase subunit B-like domain-containing protein n=1 Tax=Streptomyces sp. NPDC002018 TaxID=3364629 RepID=UPI003673B983
MLVAAAVCPCPPLLVPAVAAAAAPELDAVRAACTDALGVLAAARPDELVVVGPAGREGRGRHPQGAVGSFRGFGVEVDVVLGGAGAGAGAATTDVRTGTGAGTASGAVTESGADTDEHARRGLPPSLSVAAWLLDRVRWSAAPLSGLGVGEPLAADRCVRAGEEIAAGSERVALLVMGDASACRSVKAPGYLDERAATFDAEVARALAEADVAALKSLDAELASELKAAGRAPWQLLAGAADGAGLRGELLYDAAPYGVGYLVATWS